MANEKPISKDYLLTQLKNYETEIINKKYIEKEDGKGLSSNDYTTEEKNKLAGLENYNDTALSNRVKTVEDEVPNLATKTYVGEQIANAEHLKREIVTVLPSDEEASDNIIYMLKVESATGNDKYQEYMKIDGTLQMVGDTSVDLTDYAKTAEIPTTVAELTDSADYAKTSDVNDSISALQTDKANASDLTAHTDDADIHVTSDDKTLWNTVDGKVDKTDILTAKDSTATDDQVYSAKLVNDELDKKANNDEVLKKTDIVDNLTSTDSNKPLSANQGKVLDDTKLNKTDANKLNCITIDNVSLKEYILTNFTITEEKTYYLIAKTTCTDLPKAANFYITVETPGSYTYKVTAKELNDSNGIYVCTYRTISSSWTEWQRVCTTTVADVDWTDCKLQGDFTGAVKYRVKNGICYILVSDFFSDTVMEKGNQLICTGLPKPDLNAKNYWGVVANAENPLNTLIITVNLSQELRAHVGINSAKYFGSFSYPVAEN